MRNLIAVQKSDTVMQVDALKYLSNDSASEMTYIVSGGATTHSLTTDDYAVDIVCLLKMFTGHILPLNIRVQIL